MKKLYRARQAPWIAGLAILGLAATAFAAPPIDSAKLNTRVFNDQPASTLITTNTYSNPPNTGSITFSETGLNKPTGFANRHNFRFSDNGGATNAIFLNEDAFKFGADVTIGVGTAVAEAGIQVSPWWSENVDGGLIITPSGEIAAFGGRLPFYSFNAQSVTYTPGTTVGLDIEYQPHSLSMADPGQIRYTVRQGANTYNSPWLSFDSGNMAEDPPHGLWGILSPAYVGGYAQFVLRHDDPQAGGIEGTASAAFNNVYFLPEPTTLALLALGGLALRRQRA